MAMLHSIYKFPIVYFIIKIIDDALILPILLLILAEVDTIVVFFHYWLLDTNCEL